MARKKKRVQSKQQANAKRMSGEQYEIHCAKKMRWHGFSSVQRVGKSGDYGADVIARGFMFAKIVVQCKYYSKPVGVRAVQEVNAARQYYGASRAAVATNSTFTKAARELARRCNVELWEGF